MVQAQPGYVFLHVARVHPAPGGTSFARVQLLDRTGRPASDVKSSVIPGDVRRPLLEFRVRDRSDVLDLSVFNETKGHNTSFGKLVLPIRCVKPEDIWRVDYGLQRGGVSASSSAAGGASGGAAPQPQAALQVVVQYLPGEYLTECVTRRAAPLLGARPEDGYSGDADHNKLNALIDELRQNFLAKLWSEQTPEETKERLQEEDEREAAAAQAEQDHGEDPFGLDHDDDVAHLHDRHQDRQQVVAESADAILRGGSSGHSSRASSRAGSRAGSKTSVLGDHGTTGQLFHKSGGATKSTVAPSSAVDDMSKTENYSAEVPPIGEDEVLNTREDMNLIDYEAHHQHQEDQLQQDVAGGAGASEYRFYDEEQNEAHQSDEYSTTRAAPPGGAELRSTSAGAAGPSSGIADASSSLQSRISQKLYEVSGRSPSASSSSLHLKKPQHISFAADCTRPTASSATSSLARSATATGTGGQLEMSSSQLGTSNVLGEVGAGGTVLGAATATRATASASLYPVSTTSSRGGATSSGGTTPTPMTAGSSLNYSTTASGITRRGMAGISPQRRAAQFYERSPSQGSSRTYGGKKSINRGAPCTGTSTPSGGASVLSQQQAFRSAAARSGHQDQVGQQSPANQKQKQNTAVSRTASASRLPGSASPKNWRHHASTQRDPTELERVRAQLLESEYRVHDLTQDIVKIRDEAESAASDARKSTDRALSTLQKKEQELSLVIAKLRDKEGALRAHGETIEVLEEKLRLLREDLRVKTHDESTVRACRVECEEQAKRLSILRVEADALLEQNKLLTEEVADLQEKARLERGKSEGAAAAAGQEIQSLKQSLRERSSQIEHLRSEMGRIGDELHGTRQQNVELEAQCQAQRAIAANAVGEVTRLRGQVEEKAEEIQDKANALADMGRQQSLLELKISKLEADIVEYRAKEQDTKMLQERAELQGALERTKQSFNQVSAGYVSELESENAMLKRQFDVLMEEHREFLSLQKKKSAEEYCAKVEESVTERNELTAQLMKMSEENGHLIRENADLTSVKSKLQELEKKWLAQKDQIDFHADYSSKLGNELKDAHAELAEQRTQIRNMTNSFTNSEKIATSQYDKLKRDCEEKEEKIQALIAKVGELERVKYTPVPYDPIDAVLHRWIEGLRPAVPFFRMSQGLYLFGRRQVHCQINNERPVFRVGGGFLGFEEFLEKYQDEQLELLLTKETLAKGQCFSELKRILLGGTDDAELQMSQDQLHVHYN
ncbi:unnamed protein product [Amoebophrya sp. A25]|nr:unnamed protein product [Amoebophrya sp. A25]|eukprot:GSA25T00011814001.1